MFDESKEELALIRNGIVEQLSVLRLRLHDGKSRVYRTSDGVTFLGWRLFPGYERLDRGNVIRFRRRMKRLQADFSSAKLERKDLEQRVRAWIAHASHGGTLRLREHLMEQFAFRRGARS